MKFPLAILLLALGWHAGAQTALPEFYGPHKQAKALPVVKDVRWFLPASLGSGVVQTSETLEPGTWTIWAHVTPPVTILIETPTNRASMFFKFRRDLECVAGRWIDNPVFPRTNYILRLPPGPPDTNLSCCLP